MTAPRCVANVLEVARALRAGPRLRNDVIFVFSDGEENGDLGAAAFAGQSPLMAASTRFSTRMYRAATARRMCWAITARGSARARPGRASRDRSHDPRRHDDAASAAALGAWRGRHRGLAARSGRHHRGKRATTAD
ncbi:MAG: M28 family peptidase [Solirubrobacteraceae bacterium]